MIILYKIKIVKIDVARSLLTVNIIPTNDSDASTLRKPLRIPTSKVQEISALTSESEQLLAYRNEILKFDASFQSDWQTEKANKSAGIPKALLDRVGDEFPEVTIDELEAINAVIEEEAQPQQTEQPESNEVIF